LFSFPVGFSDEVDRLFEEIINRPWGISPQFGALNQAVDSRLKELALRLKAFAGGDHRGEGGETSRKDDQMPA
jgi:hypothetical protein